jgi:hypothetical protein
VSDLGEQFTNSIRAYCNDEGIEVDDWSSDREHYVIITGNITLDQIGSMYEYFRYVIGDELKIEYVNGLGLLRHCFKITKETT